MIRSIFIPFILLYLATSCKKEDDQIYFPTDPVTPIIPVDTTTGKTYLALGDSYTIGQSVAVPDRFPVQAAKYLTIQGIKFNDPEIIAQTGWTTANLANSITFAPPLKPPYDIVTLLIGVNNQYQRRPQQEYADEFSALLGKAIQYAGNNKGRVIVISIPDYSVTPFASGSNKALIASEIDAFNLINKTIAAQMNVAYVDITGISRLAANDGALNANDGLHPSGLQYKLWAEALVPVIKKALQ